jgi:hypothetical protein
MANYLQLVNKVINEGGLEQNELTPATWSSPEAGRRLYPRIKRAVADAWEAIQMDRNEWEFSTAELTTLLYPRFVVDDITFSAPSIGPDVGVKYKGQESGLEITVVSVQNYVTAQTNMDEDTSYKLIEFTTPQGGGNRSHLGEVFLETFPNVGDSSFTYRERGAYKLSELNEFAREPHWSTFLSYQDNVTPTPVRYIPWANWIYKELTYTTSTRSAPSFVSQDYKGDLVFYPQTLSPFYVNFVYDMAPQELTLYTDTPSLKLLPAEYHYWISWEALESIARFDKNADLLAYASKWTTRFRRKAERSLMPLMSWRDNRYNR